MVSVQDSLPVSGHHWPLSVAGAVAASTVEYSEPLLETGASIIGEWLAARVARTPL